MVYAVLKSLIGYRPNSSRLVLLAMLDVAVKCAVS